MADLRELILLQLVTIAESLDTNLPGGIFKSVSRNRGFQDNKDRPCCVILDGAETSRVTSERQGRGGARGMGPQLNTMRPEVYFMTKDKRPLNADDEDGTNNVGSELNNARFLFIRACEMDTDLQDLIGPNGEFVLTSTDTDLRGDSPGAGQMRLDLSITYVFDPTRQ